jgi:hypothetical protein
MGGRDATMDKEIGGKIGGPLLQQIRGQSARGESQHGGWGSMQRWSTRPVPMIAACSNKQQPTGGIQAPSFLTMTVPVG